MTLEIGLVLGILAVAVVLFVSEKVRVDLVALMVLLALAFTGLVGPREALTGFSNPAVVTVWAVFILSGGLTRTGVANRLGHFVLRLAGRSEIGLVVAIMLTSGLLSSFMNNVGVAALLLPVVMDITRRLGIAPSKLLIPLAFSSLLGGLVTLIGTPPNILIADASRDFGLEEPFELFDFTPVGLAVMLAGVAYMALIGRHMLPVRGKARLPSGGDEDLHQLYDLRQRLSILRLPEGSTLAGRTLAESRLGSALGVNVIGLNRGGRLRLAPERRTILAAGDALLVEGALDRLRELQGHEYLEVDEESRTLIQLMAAEFDFREVRLGGPVVGKTLRQLDFRGRFGVNVLTVLRRDSPMRTNLANLVLEAEDVLLVQGSDAEIDALREAEGLVVTAARDLSVYELEDSLKIVHVPGDSSLLGKNLRQARLGDAAGLTVLGIVRDGTRGLITGPEACLKPGDILVVEGSPENLGKVRALRELEIDREEIPGLGELESEDTGFAEVVLSPRTALAGLTLQEIHFREKYGLNVMAIFRQGEAIRSELRNTPLRHSDALLLYGSRRKLQLLGGEADFLVLTEDAQVPVRVRKAPLAAGIMAVVLTPVILGWLPIYLSAILGAVLMILTRCLTMDEAYKFIEWRAVFLIAGMLPLGAALQSSGAALYLTEKVVSAVGGLGPYAIVAALYLVTALGAQVMPTSAVAILMAPIAFNTAQDLGISPYALLMAVALSASASFMSPVAHPANILIMGPGGYRFTDYIKVGLPLTLVCLAVVLIVLPLVWPFEVPVPPQ
ncbi:MAG: SLC13 family permease [bacterium]|nr:SLC13 family permease [bacterium]